MDQDSSRLPSSARHYGRLPPPPSAPSRLPVPQRASALQRRGSDEIQVEEPPRVYLLPRPKHPLLVTGCFMLVLVAGWWLLMQVSVWWQVTQDDVH